MKEISEMSLEEVRSTIAACEGRIYDLEGQEGGLPIWDGQEGDLRDCPPGGATLTVDWAVEEHSYKSWYPTVDQAKAALLSLARGHHTIPSKDGLSVDLTHPGCHESAAYVTRRG